MFTKLLSLTVLLTLYQLPAATVRAQVFVDLHDFNLFPNGCYPQSVVVQGIDSSFCGTSGTVQ
ncbi:MAG: hypothetical protein ACLQVD_01040 [Capsulimonadaceae bacterium]